MAKKIMHRIIRLLCFVFVAGLRAAELSDTDSRQPVMLNAREKTFLMAEMRSNLTAIQTILSAISAGDSALAAEAATARGNIVLEAARKDPFRQGISAKTPPAWKSLAVANRAAFDEVARSSAKNENPIVTVRKVAALMSNCVACHATHRIVDENKPNKAPEPTPGAVTPRAISPTPK